MDYAMENALFQWEDGERRLREAGELEQADLEQAVAIVGDELKKRLGSSFTVGELAGLYGDGVDWATELAAASAGTDARAVVDAAFARYARQATNYAGGQPRERPEPLER